VRASSIRISCPSAVPNSNFVSAMMIPSRGRYSAAFPYRARTTERTFSAISLPTIAIIPVEGDVLVVSPLLLLRGGVKIGSGSRSDSRSPREAEFRTPPPSPCTPPIRSRRGTPDDALHRQRLRLAAQHRPPAQGVGVRPRGGWEPVDVDGDHMVGDDACELIEPECGDPVQNLPFPGSRPASPRRRRRAGRTPPEEFAVHLVVSPDFPRPAISNRKDSFQPRAVRHV